MTPNQVTNVLRAINPLNTPTRVSLLLNNGKLMEGDALPPDANGLIKLSMERVAVAHLSKGPLIVFIDVTSINAITTDTLAVPSVAMTAGKDGEVVQIEKPIGT